MNATLSFKVVLMSVTVIGLLYPTFTLIIIPPVQSEITESVIVVLPVVVIIPPLYAHVQSLIFTLFMNR